MEQRVLEQVGAQGVVTGGGSSVDPARYQAAIDRILESRYFSKAPLLSSFVRFIWQRALAQNSPRVTEQEIGVKVFRRQPGYDPGEDNIVRNYARQLRRRLDEYYAHEGQGETRGWKFQEEDMSRSSSRHRRFLLGLQALKKSTAMLQQPTRLNRARPLPHQLVKARPLFPRGC